MGLHPLFSMVMTLVLCLVVTFSSSSSSSSSSMTKKEKEGYEEVEEKSFSTKKQPGAFHLNFGWKSGAIPDITPKIKMYGTINNKQVCEDPRIHSFYAIDCPTPMACAKMIPCLVKGDGSSGMSQNCLPSGSKEKFAEGRPCLRPDDRRPSRLVMGQCMEFKFEWSTTFKFIHGMFLCITTDHRAAIDYFRTGVRSPGDTTSTYSHVFPYFFKGEEELMDYNSAGRLKLFEDELISVGCFVSSFHYEKPTASPILGRLSDGTTFNIDPSLLTLTNDVSNVVQWQFKIMRFRVPKNMIEFLCRGQSHSTNQVVTEERLKIVVFDHPTPTMLSVRSVRAGYPILVPWNETLGCQLVGSQMTATAKQQFHRKLLDLMIEVTTDRFITSMISFMKFQKYAEKNGGYKCTPMSSPFVPTSRYDYYLRIYDPKPPTIQRTRPHPHLDDYYLNDDTSSIGNLTQSIHCHYPGEPEPYILWLRNGKIFHYTMGQWMDDHFESSLNLPLLDPEVDGYPNFTCMAVNHLGNDSRHFFVEQKPVIDKSSLANDPHKDHKEDVTMMTIGSGNLTLSCVYKGGARTTIEWLHNDKKIPETFHYHTRDEKCRARYTKSVLQLEAHSHDDGDHRLTGNYVCVVQNGLGNDSRHFVVQQYDTQNESNFVTSTLHPIEIPDMNHIEKEEAHHNEGQGKLVTTLCILMATALVAVLLLGGMVVRLWKRNELLETSHKFLGGLGYDRLRLMAVENSPDNPSSSIVGQDIDHDDL